MMNEDVRKQRVAQYGSFLFCPEWDTVCDFRNTPDGSCGRSLCVREDPEYIRLQMRIEENRRRNEAMGVNAPEAPQTNIRTQNKTDKDLLKDLIWQKEKEARRCYERGWTRKGDSLTYEIIRLNTRLREMETQKNDRQGNRKDHAGGDVAARGQAESRDNV